MYCAGCLVSQWNISGGLWIESVGLRFAYTHFINSMRSWHFFDFLDVENSNFGKISTLIILHQPHIFKSLNIQRYTS